MLLTRSRVVYRGDRPACRRPLAERPLHSASGGRSRARGRGPMALIGDFNDTPFADLIQLYAGSGQTVAVTINLPQGEEGVFYVENGDIVDARLGDAIGRDAVRRAIRLEQGGFVVEQGVRAAQRTLAMPWRQLLMEEVVRMDEDKRRGGAEARRGGSGSLPLPSGVTPAVPKPLPPAGATPRTPKPLPLPLKGAGGGAQPPALRPPPLASASAAAASAKTSKAPAGSGARPASSSSSKRTAAIDAGEIAFFGQDDDFGEDGWNGAALQLKSYGKDPAQAIRTTFRRNTADVDGAVGRLRKAGPTLKGVVMVASSRAAARLVEKVLAFAPAAVFTDTSNADTAQLAEELVGSRVPLADNVVVTQVVPLPTSRSSAVMRYRALLEKHALGEAPAALSMEGWVVGTLVVKALEAAGPEANPDKLVAALEGLHGFDIGVGVPLGFSKTDHQASHKVWGTALDKAGAWRQIDLE